MNPDEPINDVPEGLVESRRSPGLSANGAIWLIPLVIALLVGLIGWKAWRDRGVEVTVGFAVAHGLRVGDPVRALGVEIGMVSGLRLVERNEGPGASPSGGVEVILSIDREARGMLRTDSRVWIERPRVGFGGVGGLDTLAGPRYVGVDPGTGVTSIGPFIGLLEPPPLLGVDDDDLKIMLEARARMGLRIGGIVHYRGVAVGRVVKVELAADARRVEAEVVINAAHAALVRVNSRFFSTSGIGLELGLQGLRADIESLETVIAGGVGLATPTEPGAPVENGDRFELSPQAEDAWLDWEPRIPIGPTKIVGPPRTTASLQYRSGFFGRTTEIPGWAVLAPDGRLALPASLLRAPEEAVNAILTVGSQSHSIGDLQPLWPDEQASAPVGFLARWGDQSLDELGLGDGQTANAEFMGGMNLVGDETLLVLGFEGQTPLPIPGSFWEHGIDGIMVDPRLGLVDIPLGGAVVESSSGRAVGVLTVDTGRIGVWQFNRGIGHVRF